MGALIDGIVTIGRTPKFKKNDRGTYVNFAAYTENLVFGKKQRVWFNLCVFSPDAEYIEQLFSRGYFETGRMIRISGIPYAINNNPNFKGTGIFIDSTIEGAVDFDPEIKNGECHLKGTLTPGNNKLKVNKKGRGTYVSFSVKSENNAYEKVDYTWWSLCVFAESNTDPSLLENLKDLISSGKSIDISGLLYPITNNPKLKGTAAYIEINQIKNLISK